MNISVKPFYKILESYIKYYYYLLFLNKIGIKKFIQDLKKGKGLGGMFLRTFLTLILGVLEISCQSDKIISRIDNGTTNRF